jgi:hypothetical protein
VHVSWPSPFDCGSRFFAATASVSVVSIEQRCTLPELKDFTDFITALQYPVQLGNRGNLPQFALIWLS